VLYRLSYCGGPFGELASRAHLISGMAPVGKEHAVTGASPGEAGPQPDLGIITGFV
jgi:hypothetical protein